ncbi:MAG: isoprenylcysteine carboxylmethyltransferase family protein [Actinomycetota bacterium]|nr:isoprenylcysteine carboxylmethyltransferase family protein [Actinomycetota bacterium]MDQ2981698.1 isoprenylcysteine carboxylmethyltransferase family protein [Actinomycetota bacterium]
MPLLIDREPLARDLVIGVFLLSFAAEIAATYFGRLRDESPARLRLLRGSLIEVATLGRRGDASGDRDRGTKRVVVVAVWSGLVLAFVLTKNLSGLRVGADTWATLVLGVGIAAFGVGLRAWAILTLGTHFRREVTVEAGQVVHRDGPYRWLRHPSYAGTLVTVFGLCLALGSWFGALGAVTIALLGHLPRIRVEEAALRDGLGEAYAEYANATARLAPGIW